jgi:hypothetical protein
LNGPKWKWRFKIDVENFLVIALGFQTIYGLFGILVVDVITSMIEINV